MTSSPVFSYNHIRNQLLEENIITNEISTQHLCNAIDGLIAFQQNHLGEHSTSPRAFCKLPIALFRDVRANGSVTAICRRIWQQCKKYEWNDIDFSDNTHIEKHFEIIASLHSMMTEQKFWHKPAVYIADEDEQTDHLFMVIEAHGGVVVERQEQATHIVEDAPFVKGIRRGARILLQKTAQLALVHYRHRPPSEDSWIDASNAHEADFDDLSSTSLSFPFHISREWLLDLDRFNEWMFELDYSTHTINSDAITIKLFKLDATEFAIHRLSLVPFSLFVVPPVNGAVTIPSRKRKHSIASNEAPFKRSKPARSSLTDAENELGQIRSSHSNENVTQVLLPESALPPFSSRLSNISASVADSLPYCGPVLTEMKPSNSKPSLPVIIPSYATWFDLESIHANEKRSVLEFFADDDPKHKRKYIRIRNFIVDTYRANPRVHLTATACRKLLAGDACAVIRIHNFLEQWGIINYHVDLGTVPVMKSQTQHVSSELLFSHSPYDGIKPLLQNQSSVSASGSRVYNSKPPSYAAAYSAITGGCDAGYPMQSSPHLDTNIFSCFHCHNDCGMPFRQCRNDPTVVIGATCYANGRYPIEMNSEDFVSIEKSSVESSEWSPEETSRLLDALAENGEDWNTVTQLVGSRSKNECVQRFVQLPIEDELLQHLGQNDECESVQSHSKLPFRDAANPIMAQVAFLASMVAPHLAAASAQKALQQITERATSTESSSSISSAAATATAATATTAKDDDDEDIEMTEDNTEQVEIGTKVMTPFGYAVVMAPVREDGILAVRLDFGADLFIPVTDIKPLLPHESDAALSSVSTPFGVGQIDTMQQNTQLKNNIVRVSFRHAIANIPASQTVNIDSSNKVDSPLDIDKSSIEEVAEQCLSVAAIRAKEFADEESREIFALVAELIETQMKKIDLKLRIFEDMQAALQRERAMLEQTRQEVFAERIELASARMRLQQQAIMATKQQQLFAQQQQQQKQNTQNLQQPSDTSSIPENVDHTPNAPSPSLPSV